MNTFNPAFDMPSNKIEALAVIEKWGHHSTMTFSCDRAKRCAELLSQATVFDAVVAEVDKATTKFPTWPTDPLHALAVLGEEFGELTKDMLQFTYEPHKGVTRDDIRTEAIQTAAMALRLAMSLSTYDYKPAPQHRQCSPNEAGADSNG